ncbi:glutathione peroxidase [Rhodoplanes azumiensis]|uniref:Glutathione peroxidase n=1 Tax=Rhodoplanes azumiensis TaxID=1897628 RepID=A0ABW5AG37_9BRAD
MTIDRRTLLGSLLASAATAGAASPAGATDRSRANAWTHTFARPEGEPIRLAAHAGKPILVVNTASLCGYTPQYAGLEVLWKRFGGAGLLVVGVPSDDFGGQEPGDPASIDHTTHRYGVTFPIAAKTRVRGAEAHPFYRWAALERPLDTPRWNFHKYLIDRDGRIAAAFGAPVEPTDPRIVTALTTMLA